ncbi:MerR family transcriptional regulator [Limosilactobacillus antri]|uniref:MerR family transcriptional regulator n=1 Tax=Limosilactobacillus antri TaxID=227943 RepID=UPI001F5843F9|nr:MerR family transcriptional regulator [Limosilactobacillus antri]
MIYTSGQLAKRCRVSVRTVQYYDQQGLLHATRTSTNQRQYQDADLARLQQILAYQQLGFALKDIRQLLNNDNDPAPLRVLINQQREKAASDRQRAQAQIDSLNFLEKQLADSRVTATSLKKSILYGQRQPSKLRQLRRTLLVWLVLIELLLWSLATLIWRGASTWWALLGILLSVLVATIAITGYYRHVSYLCPHCQAEFTPAFRHWLWAAHTPNTRKLACPHCQQKSYCIEEYRSR